MKHTRTAALALCAAVAAMTYSATAASAQETPVEVLDEHTGLPCNPCNVHAVGESHVTDVINGIQITTCEDEVEGFVYHDGSGETEWVGVAHGAPGCNLVNCQIGDESHWTVTAAGELGTGEGHATMRFCVRNPNNGTELHCSAERHLQDGLAAPHQTEAVLEAVCAGGARRFETHMLSESENHDEIEVVHLEER